ERDPAARTQQRSRRLDRALDVVGVVVAAADDDDVLEPTDDVELAVIVNETGVSRAQVAVTAVEPAAERGRRGLRVVPVTLRDAATADPDLADLPGPTPRAGFVLHDGDLVVIAGPTAADQRLRLLAARRDAAAAD